MFILTLLPAGCSPEKNPYEEARRLAQPYSFSYISWGFTVISGREDTAASISGQEIKASELAKNIEVSLREKGIKGLPPVLLRIEKPPHLLVISPKETIEYSDRLLLRQVMTVEEMETIEGQVDALGFSSLVVELGGFGGTFPPIVTPDASVRFIVNAAVEEWLHQYLAFKPLGFMYVLDSLGIRKDIDVVTMNETLAGIVSEDIGSEIYERYYRNNDRIENNTGRTAEFDFNAMMTETRKQTDIYLLQGEVQKAENYMEEQRKLFVQNGYHIRKLNQAYFAFHGIYGQDPGSVSPVAEDMKRLSNQSSSVKEFLDIAAGMTGYNDLKRILGE